MRTLFLAFSILTSLVSLVAAAQSTAAPKLIPNLFYDYPSSDVNNLVLGRTCTTVHAGPLALTCNPALLADEEKKTLRVNFSLDPNFFKLMDARQSINNSEPEPVINEWLKYKEPLVSQSTSEIWFQNNWWAVGVTPVRFEYASIVRNPSYPEISALLLKESEVMGKAGFTSKENSNFSFGLQTRYVTTDYVQNTFSLLDVIANPSLVEFQQQKALYLEPGAAYHLNKETETIVTAMLSNLAVYRSGSAQPVTGSIVDLGFSTAPAFAKGRLKTTTHFTTREDISNFSERWRIGALYDFGPVQSSVDTTLHYFGIGANTRVDSLTLGLAYRYQEIVHSDWENSQWSTWSFEMGLIF